MANPYLFNGTMLPTEDEGDPRAFIYGVDPSAIDATGYGGYDPNALKSEELKKAMTGTKMIETPTDRAREDFLKQRREDIENKAEQDEESGALETAMSEAGAGGKPMTLRGGLANMGQAFDDYINAVEDNRRGVPQMDNVKDDQRQRWENEESGNVPVGEYRYSGPADPFVQRWSDALDYAIFGSNSDKYDRWEAEHYNGLTTPEALGEMGLYMLPFVGAAMDARDWSKGRSPGLIDLLPYASTVKGFARGARFLSDAAKAGGKAGVAKGLKRMKTANAWQSAADKYNREKDPYVLTPRWLREESITPEELMGR